MLLMKSVNGLSHALQAPSLYLSCFPADATTSLNFTVTSLRGFSFTPCQRSKNALALRQELDKFGTCFSRVDFPAEFDSETVRRDKCERCPTVCGGKMDRNSWFLSQANLQQPPNWLNTAKMRVSSQPASKPSHQDLVHTHKEEHFTEKTPSKLSISFRNNKLKSQWRGCLYYWYHDPLLPPCYFLQKACFLSTRAPFEQWRPFFPSDGGVPPEVNLSAQGQNKEWPGKRKQEGVDTLQHQPGSAININLHAQILSGSAENLEGKNESRVSCAWFTWTKRALWQRGQVPLRHARV